MFRKALWALLAAIVVSAALSASTGPAKAAATQFTLFDATLTHDYNQYWQPTFTAPSNWNSPVNYAGGTLYLRLKVVSKPSSKNTQALLCMWRNRWTIETCRAGGTFTDEGTYWYNLGAVNTWWKKTGSFDWSVPFDVTRIMLKDHATGSLLLSEHCGNACYTGGSDLRSHVPIRMEGEVIVVAKGATLDAPGDWGGCPTSWSPECPTPTGGSTGGSSTTSTTSTTVGGGGTGAPVVSIEPRARLELDSGTSSLPFRVVLSKASTSTVTVDIGYSGGTATAGTDYIVRTERRVTFPAGSTVQWYGVPMKGDLTRELDETVRLTLLSPVGATLGTSAALGTIQNDD